MFGQMAGVDGCGMCPRTRSTQVCGKQSPTGTWRVLQGRMFSEAAFEPQVTGSCPLTPSFIYSTSICGALLWARCLAKFCPSDVVSLRQVPFPLRPQFLHLSRPDHCALYPKLFPLQTFLYPAPFPVLPSSMLLLCSLH